ncbi:MAG: Thymidylate kinase [Chlamydiae bacterium]|nr:Thymidylate kinase [Chlamydiota bacterium]
MQEVHKPYEGLFLTIEGGEGSGKTTLVQGVVDALEKRGYTVLRTREPGGTALSERLRELVLSPDIDCSISEKTELFLFLTSRIQHFEEKILPALRRGEVVICERFHDSSIAYQGGARHLGMGYVEELCTLSTEGIQPDCTLFLDLDPKVGRERLETSRGEKIDRLEREPLQFHQEVRQGYLHLADKHHDRISVLDASLSQEEVLKAALSAIESKLLLRPHAT